MNWRTHPTERGAVTLLLVMGLVLLATLASAYSSRAVLTELLVSQGLDRGAQARLAAQAALATAEAVLLQPQTLSPDHHPFLAQKIPCPPQWSGLQWQCSPLLLPALSAPPEQGNWQYQAIVVRDLIESPHVWQVQASASGRSMPGQASVRESVFMPELAPASVSTPTAALILNGCASEMDGSNWQICPPSPGGTPCSGATGGPAVYSHAVPDTNHNGRVSAKERQACLAFATNRQPAGSDLASAAVPAQPTPACNRAAWRSAFGDITPTALQAWSHQQERHGLHAQSRPARSVYWIDKPADWTQSLGTPEAPVLLVFSSVACAQRCPKIAAGVHIHGMVYADAGCDDEKMRGWQTGWVEGQVVVEAGLPQVTGNGRIWARSYARSAYALHWPDGIDSRRVQRVAGSHWTGTP